MHSLIYKASASCISHIATPGSFLVIRCIARPQSHSLKPDETAMFAAGNGSFQSLEGIIPPVLHADCNRNPVLFGIGGHFLDFAEIHADRLLAKYRNTMLCHSLHHWHMEIMGKAYMHSIKPFSSKHLLIVLIICSSFRNRYLIPSLDIAYSSDVHRRQCRNRLHVRCGHCTDSDDSNLKFSHFLPAFSSSTRF